MNVTRNRRRRLKRIPQGSAAKLVVIIILVFGIANYSLGVEPSPQVTLSTSKAAPRTVEPLTERSVLRDYKFAWINLSQAMESNSIGPMNALLDGAARTWLNDAVSNQRTTGLTSRYRNQNHKLEAIFYAPEGDVMELHDTAEFDLEILDGSKTIHNEHAVVHYVVLMTPGADRWVIRQLQAVPQF